MMMNLRDWLIILGILIVLSILIDGLRRIWASRKRANELHFGLEKNQGLSRVQEELPHGGSRIKRDVSIPTGRVINSATSGVRQEPTIPHNPQVHLPADPPDYADGVVSSARVVSQIQPETESDTDELESGVIGTARTVGVSDNDRLDQRSFVEDDEPLFDTTKDEQPLYADDNPLDYQDDFDGEQELTDEETAAEKEFFVIYIEAKGDNPFTGKQLQDFFTKQHLHFGAMSIFHRHTEEDGNGPVLFSIVNGVNPGIFDLETMAELTTPRLSFFMELPGPENPQKAFLAMVECCYELGGTLKDDQLSDLTGQTLEHYLERIRNFELGQLKARKVAERATASVS